MKKFFIFLVAGIFNISFANTNPQDLGPITYECAAVCTDNVKYYKNFYKFEAAAYKGVITYSPENSNYSLTQQDVIDLGKSYCQDMALIALTCDRESNNLINKNNYPDSSFGAMPVNCNEETPPPPAKEDYMLIPEENIYVKLFSREKESVNTLISQVQDQTIPKVERIDEIEDQLTTASGQQSTDLQNERTRLENEIKQISSQATPYIKDIKEACPSNAVDYSIIEVDDDVYKKYCFENCKADFSRIKAEQEIQGDIYNVITADDYSICYKQCPSSQKLYKDFYCYQDIPCPVFNPYAKENNSQDFNCYQINTKQFSVCPYHESLLNKNILFSSTSNMFLNSGTYEVKSLRNNDQQCLDERYGIKIYGKLIELTGVSGDLFCLYFDGSLWSITNKLTLGFVKMKNFNFFDSENNLKREPARNYAPHQEIPPDEIMLNLGATEG